MSEDYRTLKESFYRRRDYGHSEESDGPIIAAAGPNNPQLLRSLLDEAQQLTPDDRRTCVLDQAHSELLDRRWATPLLRAIERRRNDNITLLLQAGGDPNGIDRASQTHHARRFRRFCADRLDLSDFLIEVDPGTVGTVISQTTPPLLTTEEIASRRSRISPFWTEACDMEIDYSDDGALLHSVLMAATTSPEMLVSAWNSGADTSHWTHLETQMILPDEIELCPSQLSISTPLHAAIAAANPATLKTALDLGCSPNTRAFITGSQALTAAQYAIILGDTDAWSTLLAHPGTGASIITPVFCVHAMHFAAALLRPDLLRLLGTRLKDVGRTALGHTLLHIACLPHDEQAVQANALKVQQSIHDSRRVRTQWRMREACEVIWDASGTGPPASSASPDRLEISARTTGTSCASRRKCADILSQSWVSRTR